MACIKKWLKSLVKGWGPRAVKDYCIVARKDPWGLQVDIEMLLKNGWQPVGGVSISRDHFHGGSEYAQAMVRYNR